MKHNFSRYYSGYLAFLLSLSLYILLCLPGPVMAGQFSDVNNSWAQASILHLNAIGVCNGYENNLFKPQNNITRAEFTKLLVGAMGKGTEAEKLTGGQSGFIDVADNYWAKPYIILANEMGLSYGEGDIFHPGDRITREEAACMISRTLKQTTDESREVEFTDRDKISDWAVEGVTWAYLTSLITGFEDGSFKPEALLTREQAVVLLERVMDKKGYLYNFNGVIKNVNQDNITISIGSRTSDFKLAPGAVLVDKNRIIDTLKDRTNTRVNFNIDNQGRIIFARLEYDDDYLPVVFSQMDSVDLSPRKQGETAEDVAVDKLTLATQNTPKTPEAISNQNPELSLATAQHITGVDVLKEKHKLSGQGVVIAVIDSGIDTNHPDLQRTSTARKIIDWVNFSWEGRVNTSNIGLLSSAGIVKTEFGEIKLPENIHSVSGQYRYGLWNEEWISYIHDFDFTGNGRTDDRILVMAIDSLKAGVYDQVLVDTNNNHSLVDEVPLNVFRDYRYSYASFPATVDLPRGFPFILCDINGDGSQVVFGYDSNGHGTHVAGIASANGTIQGVAPDSQLMAIKVVDSAGNSTLGDTLKAVCYAIEHGADIINISLGNYDYNNQDVEYFTERINKLARDNLICIAIGNNGPGLASLASPGDADNALSVGAYIAPEMWEVDYGWKTPVEGIWYFNSIGPRLDGALRPDLIAPGSAVSTCPRWMGTEYAIKEGTSMATPFASGVSALLIQGMWEQGKGINSLMVKNALTSGAHILDNYTLVEQGHGVIDAVKSWEQINKIANLPEPVNIEMFSGLINNGTGIFSKNFIPGVSSITIFNSGKQNTFINWESKADWLKLDQSNMQITAGSSRNLTATYDEIKEPGLYCGLIEGWATDNPEQKIEFLNTIIVPEIWDKHKEFSTYNSLPAGQTKRYYLQVPDGANKLLLNLKVLGTLGNLQGRARIYVFDPAGNLYKESAFAGLAPDRIEEHREIEVAIDKPVTGVWEVVVYSSSTLSLYGKKQSDYVLAASLPEIVEEKTYIDSNLLAGCVISRSGETSDLIQLTIIDNTTNLPYNGRLLINNRLYYVENGRVKIHSNIIRQSVNLTIRKVIS